MPTADPILIGIDSKTFSLVRKGFDPDEVRSYLFQVSLAVDRMQAAAPEVPASSGAAEVVDDEALAAARAELDRLRADQAAVKAWFGEEGRATADEVPGNVRDAAATADALVRAAEERAAALAPAEAAPAPAADPFAAPVAEAAAEPAAPAAEEPSTAQRWDEVGGSVARILAGAEEEANSIRAAAETSASITRDEAEHLRLRADENLVAARSEAEETVARAQRDADALTRAAEVRAAELRRAAEDGARTHVAEVLAQAEVDLDRTRRELDAAHDQLADIHTSVGESMAKRPERRELADADSTYAAAVTAADEAVVADATPAVEAPIAVAGDPFATGPATTDGQAPPAPAPLPAPPRPPAPALVEHPTPPEPPLPEEPAPVTFSPFSAPAANGTAAVTPAAPAAPAPAPNVLAEPASEPDPAPWSPRRTFGERLGLGRTDAAVGEGDASGAADAAPDPGTGWQPPAPPPPR